MAYNGVSHLYVLHPNSDFLDYCDSFMAHEAGEIVTFFTPALLELRPTDSAGNHSHEDVSKVKSLPLSISRSSSGWFTAT